MNEIRDSACAKSCAPIKLTTLSRGLAINGFVQQVWVPEPILVVDVSGEAKKAEGLPQTALLNRLAQVGNRFTSYLFARHAVGMPEDNAFHSTLDDAFRLAVLRAALLRA